MTTQTRTLIFGNKTAEPTIRTIKELEEVLYNPHDLREPLDEAAYYMYRDLYLTKKDREILKAEALRYDITIIPPKTIGDEYIKTLGHYHPPAPETDLSYPELYEVLKGKAHYLLQKKEGEDITDVVLIEANEGDKVVIPPYYGHITINPGNREIKMANLVSRCFNSIYEPYRKMRGGAYYELTTGFVKNNRYSQLPKLRIIKAKKIPELGLNKSEEIYSLIRKAPESLKFLNRPQEFSWLIDVY